jgi:hypothetical protein
VEQKQEAVFLGFGFVSAQSQGCSEPAPSPKPRQNPKILAPKGFSISSKAQGDNDLNYELVCVSPNPQADGVQSG